MEMQTIQLFPDDDIVSINDQLGRVTARRVLLVLPSNGRLLTSQVALARLRRQADMLRLEVGLVTSDPDVRPVAKALGFPLFRTAEQAADNERRWRRGRRRIEKAGLSPAEIKSTFLSEQDRLEASQRMQPKPRWQKWLWRYVGIIAFFMTLAIFYVGVAYAVPGATITLRPYTEHIAVSKQVVADPELETVNFSGASIPARVLTITEEWVTEVETTGRVDVADAPARGKVVFVNTIEQPASVPAGTRVTTSAGTRIVYQTLNAVDVPGVVGGTAEVDIVAVEPGPQGNVAANQINRIEGSLDAQLEVRNLEELTGGAVRSAAAVAQADLDRLEAQVTQYLQTVAVGRMNELLGPAEFLAQESVRVTNIEQQTFTHFVGEQTDRVALEIRAQVQGTAVNTNEALDLIYNELALAVKPNYALVPDSFAFFAGDVLGVDSQGRVSFEMRGEGIIAAELDISPHLETIAGQPVENGTLYLYDQLPLQTVPTARVIPNWFGRLPYLPARMQTEIVTD